jgi:hypothetical protein
VTERLPLIGAILIPRYTTVRSDFAEERVREVFFAAVAMERNIGFPCCMRKPSSLDRVAENDVF